MTLIEFIGFIITMVAFFFLMIKQSMDRKKTENQLDLEEGETLEEHEALVREMLQAVDIDVDLEEKEILEKGQKPPPIPIKKIEEPATEPQAEWLNKIQRERIARDAPPSLEEQNKVREILRNKRSLKDAFILKELLGPPKGLGRE